MTVITVDFGKEKRERDAKAVVAFRRLAGIVADIEADPGKYLEMANERIMQLDTLLRSARDALRESPLESIELESTQARYSGMDTIVVRKSEYQRLLACAKIVRGSQ